MPNFSNPINLPILQITILIVSHFITSSISRPQDSDSLIAGINNDDNLIASPNQLSDSSNSIINSNNNNLQNSNNINNIKVPLSTSTENIPTQRQKDQKLILKLKQEILILKAKLKDKQSKKQVETLVSQLSSLRLEINQLKK